MFKKIMNVLISVALCISACGCAQQENKAESQSTSDKVSFTDDAGNSFEIEKPKRIASLLGSFADIWASAGGAETLVATAHDTWTNYKIDLSDDCVDIGGIKDPNVEKIIAAKPDLVLASCNTTDTTKVGDALKSAGINVAYFDVNSFDDYLRMLKICCDLTGKTENYKTYGEDVKAKVDEAIAKKDGSNPKVLSIRATGTAVHAKGSKDNLLGEMLVDMGCTNIADSDETLLDNLSIEQIITDDPDYIFVILHGTDAETAKEIMNSTLLQNPAWSSLKAVQNNHFYTMDNALFNLKPNARWAESYEKLAEILYDKE